MPRHSGLVVSLPAWGGRCAEADRKTPQAKAGTGVTKISTQSTACRGVWSIFIAPGETLKNKCTSYAVSIMPGRQSRKSRWRPLTRTMFASASVEISAAI